MSYYIAEVVEGDDGELMLQFTADMLKQMGWDEQTLLEWIIEEEDVYIREASK